MQLSGMINGLLFFSDLGFMRSPVATVPGKFSIVGVWYEVPDLVQMKKAICDFESVHEDREKEQGEKGTNVCFPFPFWLQD